MKSHRFSPVGSNVSFVDIEKKHLSRWYEEGIVEKYLHRNDGSDKRFSFLDGPITANNPMGVHHAWGRTFKDLWQRYYNLKGYEGRFQNGFDCQGLWVEVEVEKELGLRNKKDIENLVPGDPKASVAQFVELCKDRVRKFSVIQTEQSKRLGYIVDWDNSYYTMSDENNYMIWHFLKVCHENGWIYKGKESVPWCPRCQTAISQHEMLTEDYKEVVHTAIYFELPLVGRDDEYLLVWTTTPWTLPANIAVAVDESLDYALVQGERYKFWVAKDRVDAVFKGKHKGVIKTVKGKELVGLRYTWVFDHLPGAKEILQKEPKRFHIVIATDQRIMPVTTSEGTGLVHTAVSAGTEDFQLGKKFGLPMIPVIDDSANYLPSMGEFAKLNAKKHPEIIIEYLQKREEEYGENWIFDLEQYKHRYPNCWRCKTELVWKVAEEWYIAMDRSKKSKEQREKSKGEKGKTLREMMMETAKQITWMPGFGLERELDWLSNMHDWLISKKNRYWGLALPIWECGCGWFTVIGGKDELKSKATNGWDSFDGKSPHKPFIDDVVISCEKCGKPVRRLPDVGNVWLDAGIVGFSTLIDPQTGKLSYTTDKKYWSKWYPADFITESFPGQFKNWFYSMIAMSTVLEQKTCFRTVLGYASMLGEDGRPMHKSWGNAIEFNEGADRMGVDVMRWMFATHNPEQNLLFGYKKADETRRQFHLLLWNIYNFFVTYALLDRWNPEGNKVGKPSANVLDMWIREELDTLTYDVTGSLDVYDAYSASTAIGSFVTDLSQWWLRRSRERVGPSADKEGKEAFYQTLYDILVRLCILLAPFTPFLSEEMYTNLTEKQSVHLSDWPEASKEPKRSAHAAMSVSRRISELGHAQRKALGIKVRQPLASCTVRNAQSDISGDFIALIRDELNVKDVVMHTGTGDMTVELDTVITPDLASEGLAREYVRGIQALRKERKCSMDALVDVSLPKESENKLRDDDIAYIRRHALVKNITWANELSLLTG